MKRKSPLYACNQNNALNLINCNGFTIRYALIAHGQCEVKNINNWILGEDRTLVSICFSPRPELWREFNMAGCWTREPSDCWRY